MALLGGFGDFLEPLPLSDGSFLHLQESLHLVPTEHGDRWKVMQSRFQYQLDDQSMSKRWVFRYDYVRQPELIARELAPMTPHLNINGDSYAGHALADIHFPTRRIPLESVLRLLITDFGVPTHSDAAVWRPMLSEAERSFWEIAHENPPPNL